MKRRGLLLLVLLGVTAFPRQASANSGTPLMWAAMGHLFIGNLLIGMWEGVLLAWLASRPKQKCVLVMILANYVSAWVGGVGICPALAGVLPMDLNNGWRWFWFMVVVSYGLTLILEWPFVAWCVRGAPGWWRRSVRVSFIIQSASYVPLFVWYWAASGTSLYTKMNVVAPGDLALSESVHVYFIDPTDGDVHRRTLAGGPDVKVFDLDSANRNDRLLLIGPYTKDASRWDLVARLETEDRREQRFENVIQNLRLDAAPSYSPQHEEINFGKVPALGTDASSQWECYCGFWPVEGLKATHKATGQEVSFSLETPFIAWTVRHAVLVLPGVVLFQLGKDQICAFDPANRRVALLWHGRGPLPVIEKREPSETDAGM